MIIMGLDPGTAIVGWAVIRESSPGPKALAYGVIKTEKTEKAEFRLKRIHESLLALLARYTPDAVVIEDLFFARNVTTAFSVGQARGILLLACAEKNLPVFSYPPMVIKRCVTGDGKADKKQVEYMVMLELHLTKVPKSDDAADALAIALTHAFSHRLHDMQKKIL